MKKETGFMLVKHLILFFSSIALFLSVFYFISSPVNSKKEASRVCFGYPISFACQDFSKEYESITIVPWYQGFDFHRKTEILFLKLFASFFSVFLGVEIVIFLLERIKMKIVSHFQKSRIKSTE